MSSVRRITAAAPLSMLVAALSRVQWGPIGGARNRPAQLILLALGSNAKHLGLDTAGEITITANQLADMAGYSARHMRRWMPVLEGLGLIQWRRGGVVDGRPVPGTLRVSKRLLAQWVRDWTARADAAIEARRLKTLARLKALTNLRIPPYRPRWKRHADMLTSPPPSTRGEQGDSAPRPLPPAGDSTPERKDIDMRLTPVHPKYLPKVCTHTDVAPARCRTCIDIAVSAQERAILEYQAEQTRRAQESTPKPPTPFIEYMQATYPNEPQSRWPRLTMRDPRARELAGQTK